MTGDQFPKTRSGRLIEAGKIMGAIAAIVGGCSLIWGLFFGPLRDIYSMASDFVDDFRRLEVTVQQLQADVARANGEDRVIRQPEGLSYIQEPVTQGDNVVMILVVSRTRLGEGCRLIDWVPIFTDELNIPTPGERARRGPVSRQIDTNTQRLRVEMVPPEILRPGRIVVYLTLTYRCPGSDGDGPLEDRTEGLPYRLLPAS
ncbi:hypothetical protein [Ponticoccus litoralis]|uniref:Uncharacterized protein n=1 Tax=Ponticoccus litoralis TaxID=422297 RepID=A0AAW9SER5_9RHOB